MAKETQIGLVCVATGDVTEFEVSHAERILAMRDSGWAIPEDSDYQLGEDGSIVRRDKKKGK